VQHVFLRRRAAALIAAAVVCAAAAGVVELSYLWLKGSSMFQLRSVAVRGGTESERVAVRSTTSHNKQELQAGGVVQRLTKGTHTVRVTLPEDAYQNWNLDYLQLDPVKG